MSLDRFLPSKSKYEALSIKELEAEIKREQDEAETHRRNIQEKSGKILEYIKKVDELSEEIEREQRLRGEYEKVIEENRPIVEKYLSIIDELTKNLDYLQDTLVRIREERTHVLEGIARIERYFAPSVYDYSELGFLRRRERSLRGTLGYLQGTINTVTRSRGSYRGKLRIYHDLIESAEKLLGRRDALIRSRGRLRGLININRNIVETIRRQIVTIETEIKIKEEARKVPKVEVVAYVSYVARSLGGKSRPPTGGRDFEYKVFRLVHEGTEDKYRADTIELWWAVFSNWAFKYCPICDRFTSNTVCMGTGESPHAPTETERMVTVEYGKTNRRWEVPRDEAESAQQYCLAQKIEMVATRYVRDERASTIKRAFELGWDGMSRANVGIYYGGSPPP